MVEECIFYITELSNVRHPRYDFLSPSRPINPVLSVSVLLVSVDLACGSRLLGSAKSASSSVPLHTASPVEPVSSSSAGTSIVEITALLVLAPWAINVCARLPALLSHDRLTVDCKTVTNCLLSCLNRGKLDKCNALNYRCQLMIHTSPQKLGNTLVGTRSMLRTFPTLLKVSNKDGLSIASVMPRM